MICLLNIFKKFSFFFFGFFCFILGVYVSSLSIIIRQSRCPKTCSPPFSFTFVDFFLPKTPYLKSYYFNSSLFVYVYS